MRKILRLLLGLWACGVLVFASMKLADYIKSSRVSADLNSSLAQEAVVVKPTAAANEKTVTDTEPVSQGETVFQESEAAETPEEAPEPETAPLEVDFQVLAQTNPDVVAWIYCPDTPISFPVVQGTDNSYYLYRLFDGTWNKSGTLFVDFRNSGDFQDKNTVIYGHNMKNDSMLGTLPKYADQKYYDKHPIFWLLTPEADYKVELAAGYETQADGEIYTFGASEEATLEIVRRGVEKSDFDADVEIEEGDRFLTLSTCSESSSTARYVLIGRLVEME